MKNENEKISYDYRMILILNPDINLKELDKTESCIKEIILSRRQKINNFEHLGLKKLAYEINKKREGYYLEFTFNLKVRLTENLGEILTNLERQARIDDNIMKYIIIKEEKDRKGI